MKTLARAIIGLGVVLLATPARAVNIDGSWAICFPPAAFCGAITASMTAVGNAFTISTSFCDIHGTVDPMTGAITVPPGECNGQLFSFTGTATDTTFTATASFPLCVVENIQGVRECGACDDGNQCTVDGCGATPCSAAGSSCTSAFVKSGTACDDGNACTANDHCGIAGTPAVCGGEQAVFCFDDNPCTNDACDTTTGECVFTPNNDPCTDGTNCTVGDTCSGGTCVPGPALECGPCEVCRPIIGCDVGPRTDCRQSLGKAKLALKDAPDDARDKIKWSWGRGDATTAGDLGNPVTTDDYTLCVFDGSPFHRRLFLDSTAPAGGSCANGGSCWTARGTPAGAKGFLYKDSKILLPDGLKRVKLQPGAAGKAKASVTGLGTNLDLPSPMNVTLPVLVQLQGESGACFESNFTAAKQNVEDTFKAVNSPSGAFVESR